jgi:hypothetical protein
MLKFSEWEKIHYPVNESIKDDVQNWLSRTFGGKIDKIDYIISELVSAEKDYAKEWEKKQLEISGMKGQISSGEISSAEEEDFKRKIKEKSLDLEKMDRQKTQKVRSLNMRVLDLAKGNPRITKYWNLKKSEAEVEVAENLYNLSKNLPDRKFEDELYKRYLKAVEDLRKREKEMDEMVPDEETDQDPKEDKERKVSGIKSLLGMSISEFTSEIKKYDKTEQRKIQRALIDQKNLGLNELRSLRRNKSRDLDRSSGKDKEKVLQKYNPLIYELGEKIDKIREKISYINE